MYPSGPTRVTVIKAPGVAVPNTAEREGERCNMTESVNTPENNTRVKSKGGSRLGSCAHVLTKSKARETEDIMLCSGDDVMLHVFFHSRFFLLLFPRVSASQPEPEPVCLSDTAPCFLRVRDLEPT